MIIFHVFWCFSFFVFYCGRQPLAHSLGGEAVGMFWAPSVGQAPSVAKRLACFWSPSVGSVAKRMACFGARRWARRPRWQSPLGWKVPFGGSGALGGRAHWAGNYPSVGQAPSVAKPIFGLKYLSVGQAPSAAKPIGLQSTPRWVRCPRWQSPLGWKVGDRFTAFKALCAPALRSAAAQENTLLWLDLTQAECLLVPRRFA